MRAGEETAELGAGPEGGLRALRLGFSLLLLLQLAGGFLPGPPLWSVNHLAYAPLAVRLIWPLVGLAFLWLPITARLGGLLVRLEPAVLGRRWVAYGLMPLVFAAAFTLLRNPTHFLGDGYLLGQMLAAGLPFSGYEFMSFHLPAKLYELLDLQGETAAYHLFAVISVVAGAVYMGVAAWAARSLGRRAHERMLLYGLLVWSALLEMFFGYVEGYAFLAVALLWFAVALIRYYRATLPLRWVALSFAAALFLHLDALFLFPLVLMAILLPPDHEERSIFARFSGFVFPALVAFGLGAIVYALGGYNEVWLQDEIFGARRHVKPLVDMTGAHGLFGLRHLKDWLNLVLLLAPVPAVLIIAMLFRSKDDPERTEPTPIVQVFLIGGLWLLALMAVVNFKLGPIRDWDLFAAHSVVFILAAWLLFTERAPRFAGGAAFAVVTAFFLALPWFWLNAGAERARVRFSQSITDLPTGTQAYAREELGKYLWNENRLNEALAEYTESTRLNPHNARVMSSLGALQYNLGRKDDALRTFTRVLDVDSTFALAHETLARLHGDRDAPEQALYHARRLANRPDETAAAAAIHAKAAQQLGRIDEAIAAYERGYRLDPARCDLLESAAGLSLEAKRYDRAEALFRRVVAADPSSPSARIGLAIALWEPLRDQPVAWPTPAVHARLAEAMNLIESVRRDGDSSEMLRIWSEEIRAALIIR